MFLATIATWFGLRQRQRQGLTSPTRRPFSAFAGDRGVCSFSRMTHVPELGAGSRIPSATRLPVCPHAVRDEPCTFLLHGGMAPTRPRRTVCSVSFSSPVSSAVLPVTRCNSLVTFFFSSSFFPLFSISFFFVLSSICPFVGMSNSFILPLFSRVPPFPHLRS